MRRLLSIIVSLVTAISFAQQPVELPLWPDGAPNSSGLTGEEQETRPHFVTNVTHPTLTVYHPEKPNGMAIIMCPGGGYRGLGMDGEGYDMAPWFCGQGITYMVLKYRMPNGHPGIPLEDGEQAMRVIRRNAAQWGVDPHNVGIIGFSAGGHFASTLITEYTSEETRPDFAVLVYPVVSMNYSSVRTRENLLGARSEEEALRKRHSTFGQVHEGMPEVMLLLCNDDKAVVPDNSIAFYRALNRRGVKAEMHIYPEGGHGFWMRERYKYGDETYPAVIRWIERHRTNN